MQTQQNNSKLLPFERCENFRQLGGYESSDGRKVKNDVFYRGPALSNIKTQKDIELFQSLGVQCVFDFRSTQERAQDPDPSDFIKNAQHFPISALTNADGSEINFDLQSLFSSSKQRLEELFLEVHNGYSLLPFNNKAYQALFLQIRNGQTPIYFHCTAGKDRTGVAAALILALLDVPQATIMQDFLLTNQCRPTNMGKIQQILQANFSPEMAQEIASVACGVKEESLQLTLEAILQKYGSFDVYFEAEFGIDKQERIRLQNLYLI